MWLLIMSVSSATGAEKRHRMRPWLVQSVHFIGNSAISSSDLQSRMSTRPSHFYRKIKFSRSILNADVAAIMYLYSDRGFLDVQARAVDTGRNDVKRRVNVTIIIKEGSRTIIDSLVIKGRTVFNESEIRQFLLTKQRAPYSGAKLIRDQQTIRDSLAARGYPLCIVDKSEEIDSALHRASVAFTIDHGPLVMAGPLEISGAHGLRPIIIKRGISFNPGDTLTSGKIQTSVRQMYESGMFKYVQFTPVADSAQLDMARVSLPVRLTVEESDFFRVRGGVGYGTYEGPRISLQTSYGNILGLGRTVSLEGKYSRLIQSLHLRYTVPWFLLLPPSAEAEIYGEHHDEVTFTGYMEGLTLSLFAKTSWNFGYRVYTSFEGVNSVEVPPLQASLAMMTSGNNTQSFGSGFTYDSRDNLFDPKKGFLAASDAEIAGIIGIGTNHFYNILIDSRGYFPVGKHLTVATALITGYVTGYGPDRDIVPPQELLYAGSEKIRSIRGYAPGSVADLPGGRLVVVANILELRLAVTKWLKIAGFVDAGSVWASTSQVSGRDLRWTAGPGIRIRTPVGLLSADMGIRLNGPTAGKTGFSISVGEPF